MDFARNELAKYGWTPGSGLGKASDGISKPIAATFKNDNVGIGSSTDWADTWWDHVFNKASAQISHAKEADGSLRISATSDSRQERVMLYKHFVKPGQEEKKDYSIRISDQELFLQCEGRTARKGARASQPGKISRTLDASTTDKVSKPKKSKAKKSKAKNE